MSPSGEVAPLATTTAANEARRVLHDAGRLYALAGETRELPGGPVSVGYLTSIGPVIASPKSCPAPVSPRAARQSV